MKKVLLRAYLNNNLGDDVFVKILVDRYKNNFFVFSKDEYDTFKDSSNLLFCGNKLTIMIDKILKKFFNIHDFYETFQKKKYDLMVYIGGSLFIENSKQNIKFWQANYSQYLKNKIDYYIIGSNFGPYMDDEFVNLTKDMLLKEANDVCFRDKYSYSLFKRSDNVRLAPDILFSINSKVKFNPKKVIISVIDCDTKVDSKYTDKYEDMIVKFCEFFDKKGYAVTLMSFCKNEGDEIAINRIISKIPDSKSVNTYFYSDNIEEAIDQLDSANIIVGSRFHANIIGMALGKVVFPIAYSDKTLNVLKDIKFSGKIYDIRSNDNYNIDDIVEEDLKYVCDVTRQKNGALKHFEKLDEILEKR